MQKYVGTVNKDEKEYILNLYEKMLALRNLMDLSSELNEEKRKDLKRDCEKTDQEFNKWWNDMAEKYKFERDNQGYWSIDFGTGRVLLNI